MLCLIQRVVVELDRPAVKAGEMSGDNGDMVPDKVLGNVGDVVTDVDAIGCVD